MLEVLKIGTADLGRPPLLFVHGSYCGAWVWAEHYMDFFAQQGWECMAVSLRGHGKSSGIEDLDNAGLADYVADLAEAAKGLSRPPIVIGHSLGGMVAQLFACRHKVAGLVLMGSVGPGGLSGSMTHMSLMHPNLLVQLGRLQNLGPHAADLAEIRRGLFSPDFPDELVSRYVALFQKESHRAANELLVPQFMSLMFRPNVPVLVLGGTNDAFVPYSDFVATSMWWQGELKILRGIPHVMMLDTTWKETAQEIQDFLSRHFIKDEVRLSG